jgi:4-cresol dehydrogenase (hydroxylating)
MGQGLVGFLRQVTGELGADAVDAAPPTLGAYGVHTLPVPDAPPGAVLFPGSLADVRAIVRAANRHRIPIVPISTGRNIGLGDRAPHLPGQVVVDLARRMHRILEIDEDLGFCVVEPGVTFLALHEELMRRGSRLMLSPTAGPPDGSVLGNALEKGGGSGPLGDHFGNVCGMEVVLPTGIRIGTPRNTVSGRRWMGCSRSPISASSPAWGSG